jgi:LacI family transcriptional regulator, galactose operon repressor
MYSMHSFAKRVIMEPKSAILKPRPSARLWDIAEKLKISASTVSRALGEGTSARVRADLRLKILQMAREMNYVPHPAAQLMRKPKTHLITVLLPLQFESFSSEYFGTILSGVVGASREWETEIRVGLIDNSDVDVVQQLGRIAIGAGGILYMANPLSVRNLMRIEDLGRPIVVMASSVPPQIDLSEVGVCTVAMNNLMGAYEVTRMLLKLGHRRLAIINGPDGLRDPAERQKGFVKAMAEFHVPVDHHAIVHVPFAFEGGVRGWEQLKQRSYRPTGVVCGNDEIAVGLLEALAKDRIDCPREISVVGFDDSRLAPRVYPPLTTVRQPTTEMGRGAVELLTACFRDPDGKAKVEHRVFPAEVVNRQSVAPPLVQARG